MLGEHVPVRATRRSISALGGPSRAAGMLRARRIPQRPRDTAVACRR